MKYINYDMKDSKKESTDLNIINDIIEYIKINYKTNFSSKDIESNFFVNFDNVNRKFKKVVGCNIMKYRNKLRIDDAKIKIEKTNMSINKIATEVGFTNKYYFAKVFKKIEGISPMEYKITLNNMEKKMKNLYYSNIEIKDGFWKYYSDLVRNVTVYSVYDRFYETGRFDSFRCDWKEGQPNKPHIFWDSDVAKWIEGAAYLIEKKSESNLEEIIDKTVDLIELNQLENGYFNSYFITLAQSEIFTKRGDHELYCTGHLIEAALAYNKATGKDKLLKCMLKNVDYIYKVFIEEKSAKFVTPGHEEIEIALLKLYDYSGNEKHLELAKYFINQRGNNSIDDYDVNNQSNIPVREIKEAVGHSVRAGYLYTAMAMLAKIDNDKELLIACKRVLSNILNYRMSITGGIGSTHVFEGFTYDYDLPNSSAYNETCAAIALAMFAGEMQETEPNSLYGDVIERIYYNGFLSGISLSGDKFFYTNPLEIDRKKHNRAGEYQPIASRVKVFDCSCCPPNVVRMLATIPRYMYTLDGDVIYCNQFASSEAKFVIGGKDATLIQETNYPTDGKINFKYYGEPTKLMVRIPDWCVEYEGEIENGFAEFNVSNGETISIELPMKIHIIESNPNVQENSGRQAITRGPLVYCLEEIDNGENLRDITLIDNSNTEVKIEDGIPAPIIYFDAERREKTDNLYSIKNNNRIKFKARLIPYFSFANREETDMLVWTMIK